MAYTPPTLADFRTRFPVFASVPDPTVQAVLNEAIASVGETWVEKDRFPATLYLAAHLLASEGFGGASAGGGGAAVTGAVKRRKVGDVETEYSGIARAASGTGALASYYLTIYGQRYVALLRMNFPAVMVV